MAETLTVDIHTHILPEIIPDFRSKFGYGGFIHLDHHKPGCARMMMDSKFFREIDANCWDPAARMQDCAGSGVHVQVLSTVPVMFCYWAKPQDTLTLSMFLNDHIAGIVEKQPKQFIGLGTVPLQKPELAIRELGRFKSIGLEGVQIGSHVNDWNLSAEELFPFFQACEEMDLAVFVHPWDMMAKDKMEKYWLPWLVGMPAETSLAICSMIFGGVFERLPKLRVAFAHGGGSFPATISRIEHGFQVRPDLCAVDNDKNPKSYLGKFYLDSLVHDPAMLEYITSLIGFDRVALGTDYPFPLGELHPGTLIRSSKFSDSQKALLLGGTAMDWLGLKGSNFLST